MRRFLAIIALGLAVPTAHASPELANQWAAQAGQLYTVTLDQMQSLERKGYRHAPNTYETDLARFGATAGRLAAWNDDTSGAADLGCIFRGIAEDVDHQIEALETANSDHARRTALTRIARLLNDAQDIGPAAAYAATHPKDAGAAPQSCPANPYLEIGN